MANDPEDRKGTLKKLGGSQSDHWNNLPANQAVQALWVSSDPATRDQQYSATVAALIGIGPKDEIEGMLAGGVEALRHVVQAEKPPAIRCSQGAL